MITDFYLDYRIEQAPEGHKHQRRGWANIECPFCTGDPGYHLGYNLEGGYFFCWRCGHHGTVSTVSQLLKIGKKQALQLIKEYRIGKHTTLGKNVQDSTSLIRIGKHPFTFPTGVTELKKPHIRYLEKRGFDPDKISKEWHVQGTSPTSVLNNGEGKLIQYKYRILIPFYWEGQVVSFQCRDYTEKQSKKYLACPMAIERVHHKHIVYGALDSIGDTAICVEGALDVWRLGHSAVSTLGIGYTAQQLRFLAKRFKRVVVIFDPEKQAREQADKLVQELLFRGVDAYNYTDLETDPADMKEDDVKHLLNELQV